jgi:hypothetical protein
MRDHGGMPQNLENGDTYALADTGKDGDGQLLAEYDGKGLYFHAKLRGINRKTLVTMKRIFCKSSCISWSLSYAEIATEERRSMSKRQSRAEKI